MKNDSFFLNLADFFKVFGDGTRLKIISALIDKELSVNEIAKIAIICKSNTSHQLRILRDKKLVKYRKKGKSILYSLDDEHIKMIFDIGLLHIKEGKNNE